MDKDKTFGIVRTLNDIQMQAGVFQNASNEGFATEATIDPNPLKTWKAITQRREQPFRAIAFADVGLDHEHLQDKTEGIDQDKALATFDEFTTVKAADPPFSVVLTV